MLRSEDTATRRVEVGSQAVRPAVVGRPRGPDDNEPARGSACAKRGSRSPDADEALRRYVEEKASKKLVDVERERAHLTAVAIVQAISTNILDFCARGIAIHGAKSSSCAATVIPDQAGLSPSVRGIAAFGFVRSSRPDAGAFGAVTGWAVSTGCQAAASTAGHAAQAAERLASPRARRAAAARADKSAGTASCVPKPISSGVWPRNAECGSARLCSST